MKTNISENYLKDIEGIEQIVDGMSVAQLFTAAINKLYGGVYDVEVRCYDDVVKYEASMPVTCEECNVDIKTHIVGEIDKSVLDVIKNYENALSFIWRIKRGEMSFGDSGTDGILLHQEEVFLCQDCLYDFRSAVAEYEHWSKAYPKEVERGGMFGDF